MGEYYGQGHTISKILSANDVGLTGGHQSGICVPKQYEILSFFPSLLVEEKNPRVNLLFKDFENNKWIFPFIYYNSKLFGGTRNEYRLTCMSTFLKQNDLKPGDELLFNKDDVENYNIFFKRKNNYRKIGDDVLILGNSWKTITIKGQ